MTERLDKAMPEEKDESVYDERRVMEIRLSAWMKDPGESAKPLQPPAEHLFKTLPANGVSVYDGELNSPEEITRIAKKFMQVSADIADNRGNSIFMGVAAIFALPYTIFTLYLFLSGMYEGDVGPFLGLFGLVFSTAFGWQFKNAAVSMFYTYKDEPIRFHRESGKIYRFIPARMGVFGAEMHGKGAPTIREYEWSHVRAEVTKITMFLGRIFQTVTYLQLAVVDPATGRVTERFRLGFRDGLAGL